MEYRLGNLARIKDVGETDELTCPKCEKKVKFHVFSNVDNKLKGSFPFIKTNYVYFLVCPNCAARFTVDEANGGTFAAGESLAIGDFDLKELKEFKGRA